MADVATYIILAVMGLIALGFVVELVGVLWDHWKGH